MSTIIKGAGLAPAGGSTPAGFGAPATQDPWGGSLFRDTATGAVLSGRKFNAAARDYEMDANGRITGMTEAQQVVSLAMMTTLGSSTLTTLGNRLKSIATIGASFPRQVDSIVRDALSDAVQRGLIEIVAVIAQQNTQTGLYAVVRWRDKTTQKDHVTTV